MQLTSMLRLEYLLLALNITINMYGRVGQLLFGDIKPEIVTFVGHIEPKCIESN